MKILMVCLGNICRSPIAEGVMRKKIKENGLDWTVSSAGTNNQHTGEAPHKFSQKVCLQYGIDISTQRARTFKAADLSQFDRIYAMADDVYEDMLHIAGRKGDLSKMEMFLNELHPGEDEEVPDPWYGGEEGFLPVYKMIDETCDAIIKKYK